MTKVDRSDEIVKPKYVPAEVSKAIRQYRDAKDNPKMKQEDLARASGLTTNIIKSWEDGKAQMNQAELQKIQKGLGVYITGAKAGQPTELALKIAKRDAERAAKK